MNRRHLFQSLAATAALPLLSAAEPQSSPAFHLGAVTYNTLKNLDIDGIIRLLEKTGYEGVELRTGHQHGVEPSIGTEERAKVRQRFEKSKVRLVSYGTTCRFQSPDAAERAQQLDIAKQFVDLAHDTGAMGIKIQPMGFPEGVSHEITIGNFGASLHRLGDYGQTKDVEIWMEVHGKGTADPPVAAAIIRAARHPSVGVCWNSNPQDLTGKSIKESFHLLKPWIRSVHLHELSDQSYPYRELFALLKQMNFNRYTFAEVAESTEPERYLENYRALWTELNRSCT